MHDSTGTQTARLVGLGAAATLGLLHTAIWLVACLFAIFALVARTHADPFDLVIETSGFGGAFLVAGSMGYACTLHLSGRLREAIWFLLLTTLAAMATWVLWFAVGSRALAWSGLPRWVVEHVAKQTSFGMIVGAAAGTLAVLILVPIPLLPARAKKWPVAALTVFVVALIALRLSQPLIAKFTEVLFHWQRSHWGYSQAVFGSATGAVIGCIVGPAVGFLIWRLRRSKV